MTIATKEEFELSRMQGEKEDLGDIPALDHPLVAKEKQGLQQTIIVIPRTSTAISQSWFFRHHFFFPDPCIYSVFYFKSDSFVFCFFLKPR